MKMQLDISNQQWKIPQNKHSLFNNIIKPYFQKQAL